MNKKIEQKKEPIFTQKEKEKQEKKEEGTLRKNIIFPSTKDDDFLEKIQEILASFCLEVFQLEPSKITKQEILPQAKKHLATEELRMLTELLQTYEKARFAKLPIDKKLFLDQLELFFRKTKFL